MMHCWFECKISYEKTMENGMAKKITEPYLVDALSFTEAEARIIEEITPFISGEYTVADIKRAKYSEIFHAEEESADRWFKAKLNFITLDEKNGKEKKTATNILVQAADLRQAVKKIDQNMKGSMADYVIASIQETAIMDVFPYAAENDKSEFNHKRA
jgi:chlorite dismutase